MNLSLRDPSLLKDQCLVRGAWIGLPEVDVIDPARRSLPFRTLRQARHGRPSMLALGAANSQMKDFYDVWICSKHPDFDTGTLLKAIDATFKNRETPAPGQEFEAFTTKFVGGHRVQ